MRTLTGQELSYVRGGADKEKCVYPQGLAFIDSAVVMGLGGALSNMVMHDATWAMAVRGFLIGAIVGVVQQGYYSMRIILAAHYKMLICPE